VRVQLVLPAATATDIWEISGVPLSALDANIVMTVDDCVNAALACLDLGEEITMPSIENVELLEDFDEARTALLIASQSGKPAIR
jgi:short-subunit dehydrogenase